MLERQNTDARRAEPAPTGRARLRAPFKRWLLAVVAAALVTAVSQALPPMVHESVGWILACPVVVLVSLRQGFGPGLLTALLCALGSTFADSSRGSAPSALPIQWGVFGVASIVIALACSQSPRSRRRAGPLIPFGASLRVDTPLTRWLEAVLCGAALIPLTLFASACWWGHTEAISTGRDRVTRANNVTLRHAERTFATAFDVLRQARDLAAVPDAQLRAADGEVRQRLQDMRIGMSALQAIMIWDAQGHSVVGTYQDATARRTTIADRPYFLRAQRGEGDFFLSDPITGRLSGVTVVNAVARRTAPDGSFAGVVVVALFPGYFQDFYQSLASEESGLGPFALFTADGTLLARWPIGADGQRVPEDSKLGLAARAGETRGLIRVRSKIDDRSRMISFTRLSGLPLYAAAAIDEAVMFEPWRRFVAMLAAVLGPLAVGLVYVSWVALKKTRREQVVLLELQVEMQRRAQTEKALAQAQRLEALSALTGGVAHDFNNLLAIVNGNIHMIRRHHPEVGGGRHLTAIARAVASGVRLTRQLLSFARRQALKPEQIVLQSWLPGMADLLQSTVGHGIALQVDVDPATPPIRVDAGELELALINLASNARDAMAEVGTLQLRVSGATDGGDPRQRVTIRVTDTGTGIAPELLNKVFEPFFTTKPPSKGTGLGLSQVFGFCQQAGGAASVDSSVGRGTTVTLAFPADAPDLSPVDAAGATGSPVRLTGCVLLVEDDPDVAQAHRELLESTGMTVDVAASGEEALSRLAAAHPSHDLVLSDIAMPGSVDGIQLAVRLKAERPGLPVVLLTGYAARLDEAQALGCRVLGKPAEPEHLLAALGQALQAEATAN